MMAHSLMCLCHICTGSGTMADSDDKAPSDHHSLPVLEVSPHGSDLDLAEQLELFDGEGEHIGLSTIRTSVAFDTAVKEYTVSVHTQSNALIDGHRHTNKLQSVIQLANLHTLYEHRSHSITHALPEQEDPTEQPVHQVHTMRMDRKEDTLHILQQNEQAGKRITHVHHLTNEQRARFLSHGAMIVLLRSLPFAQIELPDQVLCDTLDDDDGSLNPTQIRIRNMTDKDSRRLVELVRSDRRDDGSTQHTTCHIDITGFGRGATQATMAQMTSLQTPTLPSTLTQRQGQGHPSETDPQPEPDYASSGNDTEQSSTDLNDDLSEHDDSSRSDTNVHSGSDQPDSQSLKGEASDHDEDEEDKETLAELVPHAHVPFSTESQLNTRYHSLKESLAVSMREYVDVHTELVPLLTDFIHALVTTQPDNICSFAAQYFHKLSQ